MKKFSILLLSVLAMPLHAQSILNTLNQYQSNLKPAETSGQSANSQSKPEVKPSSESISSSTTKCEENDQTSLPLAYINSLLLEKDGAVKFTHVPSDGSLTVEAPNMISNCNSMIEWKLKKPEFKGQKAWAVEAVIRKGDVCNVDGTCSYSVKQMKNGEKQDSLNMSFKPTLKGFEECLQKSGVIKDGKIVEGSIAGEALNEKFTGLDYSGKLLLLSHGPNSPLVKAKYGKFEYQNGCDYYENVAAEPRTLLTLTDATRQKLDAEANQLRSCKPEAYGDITKFINQYEEYAADLGQVRDRLILESVKKSAAAVTAGKYTDDDLKVLADFSELVVEPKIKLARDLYEAGLDLEGDAKAQNQAQLDALLAEIKALQQAPYFTEANRNKLVQDGKFAAADKMTYFLTLMKTHQRLGSVENGTKITSGVAAQRLNAAMAQWKKDLEVETNKYATRTGQRTKEYTDALKDAADARWRIQQRNANYQAQLADFQADITPPNGHCYKYWINTQKCVTDTQNEMMDRVHTLAADNQTDLQMANEADGRAKEWGALVNEGRRYIASQNGDPAPADIQIPQGGQGQGQGQQPGNNLNPAQRQTQQTNPGNFYNFGQQQQGQGQQPYFNYQAAAQSWQGYQQQTVPYGGQQNMYQQNNPYAPYMGGQQNFMGQQAYGYQPSAQYQTGGLFNFNFGVGNQQPYTQFGYGQPQYGYGQQPTYGGYQASPYGYNSAQGMDAASWYRPYGQAYNQYSLYGR